MTIDLEWAKYHQEWWKVGVSALTPIMIAALTFFVTQKLDEKQSFLRINEQTVSEKQKIYSRVGEDLNIIYVYISDIGDFRSFTPVEILAKKRDADRAFYMYSPYWNKKTIELYEDFMKSAFRMYAEPGSDAKIKSGTTEKKLLPPSSKYQWDPQWDKLFTESYDASAVEKYHVLLRSFMIDIVSGNINHD